MPMTRQSPDERQWALPPNPKMPPLIMKWGGSAAPLPVRAIRVGTALKNLPATLAAPPWLTTGSADAPFDFCVHMHSLCSDIVSRSLPLYHIDIDRILIGVTQARNSRAHGLQARVTPLRFRDGQLARQQRGQRYCVQRYEVNGREILYLLTFCLPRFLDLDFDEKLVTIFHELFHISPRFDGDLRRHPGRYSVHTHSQRHYDAHMAQLAREYILGGAIASRHDFLRLNSRQIVHRHGAIVGTMVPRPKLLPLQRMASRQR
jgi:hypothetical protein